MGGSATGCIIDGQLEMNSTREQSKSRRGDSLERLEVDLLLVRSTTGPFATRGLPRGGILGSKSDEAEEICGLLVGVLNRYSSRERLSLSLTVNWVWGKKKQMWVSVGSNKKKLVLATN